MGGQEETVGDDWGRLREEGSSEEPTQEGVPGRWVQGQARRREGGLGGTVRGGQ